MPFFVSFRYFLLILLFLANASQMLVTQNMVFAMQGMVDRRQVGYDTSIDSNTIFEDEGCTHSNFSDTEFIEANTFGRLRWPSTKQNRILSLQFGGLIAGIITY